MPGTSLPLLAPAAVRWKHADPTVRAQWPVVLVTMPFMDADRPSIQLGLLAAILQEHGFPVRTLHANLDFAARLGVDYYHRLGDRRGRMVADWLFSVEAFGADAPDPDGRLLDDFADGLAYLDDSASADAAPQWRERLLRTRHEDVPAYLDELVESYPWDGVRVVGFSSTFQQNTASFALARRLKRRYPDLLTVFGGANFDGEMGPEWVRSIDCVDIAVVGEGDVALARLLHALAAGDEPTGIPGTAYRVDGEVVSVPAEPPLRVLDNLPLPDYAEFFERAERLGVLSGSGPTRVRLPFESSRGCWWGAKHHCTFCGLNGTTMRYRSKPPERVLNELAGQSRRYRSFRFEAVDNILDMAYLAKLFPVLAEQENGYEIFYEVKANLSRAQLRLMARAGITHIQPGIESLSSHVLHLMRKGVRAVQNVNLLRWARYYGIHVEWNLLWGFPGETEQDYADQAEIMPHLRHLRPPGGAARIQMERFSPIFTEPDTFQVRHREPERGYRYVYPDYVDLERIAYFFDYELNGGLPDGIYADVRRAVGDWSAAWLDGSPPELKYWSAPHFVQIYDERQPGREGSYSLEDTLADLYLACVSRPTTAAAVRCSLGLGMPEQGVQEVFEEFQRLGLMFLDGQFVLALALPAVAGR